MWSAIVDRRSHDAASLTVVSIAVFCSEVADIPHECRGQFRRTSGAPIVESMRDRRLSTRPGNVHVLSEGSSSATASMPMLTKKKLVLKASINAVAYLDLANSLDLVRRR